VLRFVTHDDLATLRRLVPNEMQIADVGSPAGDDVEGDKERTRIVRAVLRNA